MILFDAKKMFKEVDSCCCMFTPKQGSYMLGILTLLGLCFGELEEFLMVRFLSNLIIFLAFGAMILFDSETTRKAFFYAYFLGTFPLLMAMIYSFEKSMFDNETLYWHCLAMSKEDKFASFEVANMAECQQKLGIIYNTLLAALILAWFAFIEYWWFCSIYTHYKRYGKENTARHQLHEESV
mmetsp:Transcript_47891/g.63353  ORF Transcript_47891/g.63353 Transcript_47891/m.63353 type:complete len:182 (-) Transcript_47891:85-630(-)